MSEKAVREAILDERVLGLLACPVCYGRLRAEAERLVCGACGRGYPVVDGIPVLIEGRETTVRGS